MFFADPGNDRAAAGDRSRVTPPRPPRLFSSRTIRVPTLRMQLQPVFRYSSLNALDPGVDVESRQYAKIPAFGMVILPQNPSTENGHVPGWLHF